MAEEIVIGLAHPAKLIRDHVDLVDASEGAMKPANREIGAMMLDRIKQKYTPISPTRRQLDRSKGFKKKKGTPRRKRLKRGQLTKDVTMQAGPKQIKIFVPRSAKSAPYAGVIHDKKGVRWFRRGPGTVAKGGKADEKYIDRGVEDNFAEGIRIMEKHQVKALLADDFTSGLISNLGEG